jgi:hypothetical protein
MELLDIASLSRYGTGGNPAGVHSGAAPPDKGEMRRIVAHY